MDKYWIKPGERERKQETGAKREDADLDIENSQQASDGDPGEMETPASSPHDALYPSCYEPQGHV